MLAPGITPEIFEFTKDYKTKLKNSKVNWGFGGLSAFTFYRTYSRQKQDGKLESWADCVIRVTEGQFTILKTHCKYSHLPWNERKAQRLAQESANRMFEFKWLPPGRGLWMMGTDFVWRKGAGCLNNCGFVSTENLDIELSKPFAFLMDMSMLGCGVGFDTKGANKVKVHIPSKDVETIIVEDTREGWVELISCLIDSYLEENSKSIEPNVSNVREYGELIKGFGGVASGPEPLVAGFFGIRDILEKTAYRDNPYLTSVDITDIFNIIGKIVVAGNVRRTAEISFGEEEDYEFFNMKNWEKFPVELGIKAPYELKLLNSIDYELYNNSMNDRDKIANKYSHYDWSYKFGGYRWVSNNSIFAKVGMDYSKVAKNIAINGEPGVIWLSNMQKFGRLKDPENNKDYKAKGSNPCSEQTLETYELCCLVETFPTKHEDYWDYQRTLKFAYLYAKCVTLLGTHWTETNAVINRNRRIGCSQSGIQEAILKFGRNKYLNEFCDRAYSYIQYIDDKYANWLGVPKSIKTTSVKPSGSVSLVAGSLPGIHYAESESYYRLVRISNISPLYQLLKDAGYKLEPAASDPVRTSVVYFPVIHTEGTVSKNTVSIWEQFINAVQLQEYWADNQVSITITFKENEKDQIARALSAFDSKLKGVSLLPLSEHGYEQAPYTPASRKEIEEYMSSLKEINFSILSDEGEDAASGKFCDGDKCTI